MRPTNSDADPTRVSHGVRGIHDTRVSHAICVSCAIGVSHGTYGIQGTCVSRVTRASNVTHVHERQNRNCHHNIEASREVATPT